MHDQILVYSNGLYAIFIKRAATTFKPLFACKKLYVSRLSVLRRLCSFLNQILNSFHLRSAMSPVTYAKEAKHSWQYVLFLAACLAASSARWLPVIPSYPRTHRIYLVIPISCNFLDWSWLLRISHWPGPICNFRILPMVDLESEQIQILISWARFSLVLRDYCYDLEWPTRSVESKAWSIP